MPPQSQVDSDPRTRVRVLGNVLVVCQIVALTVLALHVRPALASSAGIVVLALAAAFSVWALRTMGKLTFRIHPEPADASILTRDGAYRLVRHPMYLAVLMMGTVITWFNPTVLAWSALICAAVVLCFKMRIEERALGEKFPGYADYAAKTPGLVPFLPRGPVIARVAGIVVLILWLGPVTWRVIESRWDQELFAADKEGHFQNLSVDEAARLIESEPELVLLDVRGTDEFDRARIPMAVLGEVDDPGLGGMIPSVNNERPVLVYCTAGYRSRKAFGRLRDAGYERLYHLHRGIWAWRLQNQPVVRGGSER